MQFFADFAETVQEAGPGHRAGPRRATCRAATASAADRMEFNTKTRTGTFYNARRHDDPRRSRARAPTAACSAARSPTPTSGESADEARAEEIQDRQRRLHHLRPADPALGSRLGLGDAQPRRLRAPDERRLPGQGRAADVPAGLLLPDSGRRPRHGLPDSHLRCVDAQGPDASATPSSGRSAAATTRPSITTGCPRPASSSAASIATCSVRARRATAGSPGSTRKPVTSIDSGGMPRPRTARRAIRSAAT